jgi:hypothetical protein
LVLRKLQALFLFMVLAGRRKMAVDFGRGVEWNARAATIEHD